MRRRAANTFIPRRSAREQCVRAENLSFLQRVHNGAAFPLIVNLVEDKKLSKTELDQLRKFFEEKNPIMMAMILEGFTECFNALDSGLATIVSDSFKALPLVLAILLIERVARRWMTPSFRYWMWSLVLLRLALPGLPESRTNVYYFLSPAPRATASFVSGNPQSLPYGTPSHEATTAHAAAASRSEYNADNAKAQEQSRARLAATVAALASPVWWAGMLLMLGAMGWASLRLKWRLRAGQPIHDPSTLALLAACRRQMKVRHRVRLWEVEGLGSPALLGILRPKILLPPGFITETTPEGLKAVLLHELAHLKRHDVLVNGIMNLVQVVHWFNPLAWLAFARMRAERELACDARVLACLNREASISYGRTLLDLLERRTHPNQLAPAAALVGIMERTADLKERLALIARGAAMPASWRATLASLAILASLGCLSLSNPAMRPLSADFTVKVPTRPAPPLPAIPPGKTRLTLPDARVLVQAILYTQNGGPQDVATFLVNWPADKGRKFTTRLSKTSVEIRLNTVEASTAPPELGIRLTRTPYLHLSGDTMMIFSGPLGTGGSGSGGFTFSDGQGANSGGAMVNGYSLVVMATLLDKDDPLGEQPLGQFLREHWQGCFEQQLATFVRTEKSFSSWKQVAGASLTMPNRDLYGADYQRKMDELGWTRAGSVEFSREMLFDLDTGKAIKPSGDNPWPAGSDARWDPILREWWIRPDVKILALPLGTKSGDIFDELARANAARSRLAAEGRPDEAGRVTRSPLRDPLILQTDQGHVFCLTASGSRVYGSILGQKNYYSFTWYRSVNPAK